MKTSPESPDAPLPASLPPALGHQDDTLSMGHVFEILLENVWLIGLCLVASLALGLGWIRHAKPVYASHTTLMLEQPKNIVNIAQVTAEDPRSMDSVSNMIQLLQSRQLLENVSKSLHLATNADFLGAAYRPGQPVPDSQAALMLMGEVTATPKGRSNILDVVVENADPHMAQFLCHGVAMEMIHRNTEERDQNAEAVRNALFPESERIREDYGKAQLALQDYREKSHVVVADKAQIDSLNHTLNDRRELRVSLESDLQQLPTVANDPAKLIGLQNIAADPAVSRLRASLSAQQEEIARMAQQYTEEHPKMVAARGNLKALQAAVDQAALAAAAQLKPNYEAILSQEKSLETMILDQSRESITYETLQHELDKSRDLYQKLQDRINETDITQKLNIPLIRLIDDATFSDVPVKPDKRKIMLACLAAGGLGGASLAFLLHAIDATIKTAEQVEHVLRLPVLATIPQFRTRKGKGGAPSVPEISSAVREALRSMAVAIQFLSSKRDAHIILFTSAQPAEGKTFCSYHCAVQLAALGHRTLLIDADLRKPSQHEMIEGAKSSPGLREYLANQAAIGEIIRPTKVENLHLLAAGNTAPNPLRLLTGPTIGSLLAGLKEQYEFIILDSAPVNPVSDTLLLAPHVHQVCLIARGGATTLRSLRHTIAQLVSTGKREPAGVILNRFQRRRGLYYYGYYAYHKSYGEHGAYGDKNESAKKA